MPTIEDSIKNIMAEVFNVPAATIDANADMDSIPSWDSMNYLALVTELEKQHDCKFSFDETLDMTSYTAIVAIMREKLNEK